MIKSSIKIENGPIMDFCEAFGFIYLDADERTAPDEKEDAVSSYAEEAGEHRDGRTCDAPFDYTAKFLIEAPNKDLTNVNARIAEFNAAIRSQTAGSDVKCHREISFYNLLNRVKITGYPQLVSVPTDVYHSNRYGALDWAQVELKIRVADPRKCDFNLAVDSTVEQGLKLSLTTDGNDIFVTTSRPLADDEELLLLRKGRSRTFGLTRNGKHYWRGKYRWHVYSSDGMGNSMNILDNGHISDGTLGEFRFTSRTTMRGVHGVCCKKASASRYFYAYPPNGSTKKITFGCAVYKKNGNGRYIPIRISNVAYFVSHVKINELGASEAEMDFSTWFTV